MACSRVNFTFYLYPLYRRLGGPQGHSGRVRKISPLPGLHPWTVQPVGSHYTDWTIATHVDRPSLQSLKILVMLCNEHGQCKWSHVNRKQYRSQSVLWDSAYQTVCPWKSDHPERGSAANTTIIMALCRSQQNITSNPCLEGVGEAFGSCGSAKWSLYAVSYQSQLLCRLYTGQCQWIVTWFKCLCFVVEHRKLWTAALRCGTQKTVNGMFVRYDVSAVVCFPVYRRLLLLLLLLLLLF